MKINIENLEFKFKFRDNEDLPATMTLIIGQFEVRGFRVRKSKFSDSEQRFVLFPPAVSAGNNKWIKIFFCYDKESWKKLETVVL